LGYRCGIHRLENRRLARVMIEHNEQALLLEAGSRLYLFACPGIQDLAVEAGRHVPLARSAE
jgi:hypothetical protein